MQSRACSNQQPDASSELLQQNALFLREQLSRTIQVMALQTNLEVAKQDKQELEKKLEGLKEEMADSAKKEALRFHILLDMFGLQLLQTQPAKDVEDALRSIA